MNKDHQNTEIIYVPIDEEQGLLKNFLELTGLVPEDQTQVTSQEK